MASHSLDVLSRLRPSVRPSLVARAEAWTAGSVPAVPRLAASVVLIRAASIGVQVYLLHRHARMAFAASMAVFPGGGLDPADHGAGVDPLVACAIRETREETSVELGAAELHDWAHWITPEFEPKRYDTRFFLAVLPVGQEARDVSGETDRAEWTTPGQALMAAADGAVSLMPPTLSILTELADLGSVSAALECAADRVVGTVLPALVRRGDGWSYVYPQPDSDGRE